MRSTVFLVLLAALAWALVGCGGSLGHDSPVQVRLESSAGTTDFTNLHLIISPNSGSATSINAASDTQNQAWATVLTGASFKEIDFTTNSGQVPYFLYVQNGLLTSQSARVRIFMDGNIKSDHVYVIAGSTATQENTVFRNNVQNP